MYTKERMKYNEEINTIQSIIVTKKRKQKIYHRHNYMHEDIFSFVQEKLQYLKKNIRILI